MARGRISGPPLVLEMQTWEEKKPSCKPEVLKVLL
jgi:hypothetical protein